MSTRDRRLDRAMALADEISKVARTEFRLARIAAGLSRADAGGAVGISPSQVDRFERGNLQHIRIDQLCRLSLAVGLLPKIRFYPDADPVRDAAQIRLLGRLQVRLAKSIRWRTEVPLVGVTDPRAWDAVGDGHGCVDAFEAETRLADLQATERRVLRKFRDDPTVQHVVLVIADTRANRKVLAFARDPLRGNFPLDTRAALLNLSAGHCPGANAIVVV
jgi:transcriptional regulator with XRE-family HTH domain